MNRIEIVGMFTALKALAEKDDIESIKKIIDAVLEEAQYAKKSKKKQEDKQ